MISWRRYLTPNNSAVAFHRLSVGAVGNVEYFGLPNRPSRLSWMDSLRFVQTYFPSTKLCDHTQATLVNGYCPPIGKARMQSVVACDAPGMSMAEGFMQISPFVLSTSHLHLIQYWNCPYWYLALVSQCHLSVVCVWQPFGAHNTSDDCNVYKRTLIEIH
jgi:hypothetical protein